MKRLFGLSRTELLLILTALLAGTPLIAAESPKETMTRTYASGGKYQGEMQGGLRDGQGTYWYANGDVYSGEWKEGLKDGWGTYRWPDGNRYEGQWVKGERHGSGVFVFSDGGIFDGEWRYNEPVEQPAGRMPPPRRMGSE